MYLFAKVYSLFQSPFLSVTIRIFFPFAAKVGSKKRKVMVSCALLKNFFDKGTASA